LKKKRKRNEFFFSPEGFGFAHHIPSPLNWLSWTVSSDSVGDIHRSSASILSRDEVLTIFRKIDVNGNGEISPSEFIKAFRKDEGLPNRLGLSNTIRQEDESLIFFSYTFEEIDTDDSKSISMEEFLTYYTGEGELQDDFRFSNTVLTTF
jgi:Ca2+-binding EF-hand superfamily protein